MMPFLYYIIFCLNGFQSDYNLLFLKEINLIRAQGCACGGQQMPAADPIIWDIDLAETSRRHAQDMQDNNFFSHINQINQDVGMRADSIYYRWDQIGENIAKGFLSDFEVLRAWLNSPPHCEMLLFSNVTEMGAKRVGDYWVVNFGKPQSEDKSKKQKEYQRKKKSALAFYKSLYN